MFHATVKQNWNQPNGNVRREEGQPETEGDKVIDFADQITLFTVKVDVILWSI